MLKLSQRPPEPRGKRIGLRHQTLGLDVRLCRRRTTTQLRALKIFPQLFTQHQAKVFLQ